MTKKQSIMIAMAGAALMAATQAQAQFNYNNEDLLLNVRSATGPLAYADFTVDLGNVATFADRSGTTVLDTDVGSVGSVTWSTTPGYTPLFPAGDMIGSMSWNTSSKSAGFTVVAANASASTVNGLGANTFFMTRATGTTQSAGTPFPQQSAQGQLANAIGSIGVGAAAGTSAQNPGGDTLYNDPTGSSIEVATASEVTINPSYGSSFQTIGQQNSSTTGTINFGQLVDTIDNGPVEAQLFKSGATQYASLYEVPETGQGPDTLLGYFSYYGTGEVTYTEQNDVVTAVPEPSTYGLLAGFGLLAVALRRQFRLLKASA